MEEQNEGIRFSSLGLVLATAVMLAGCGSDSSSGAAIPSKEAWDYLNPDIIYGEITDTRDGQVYKTVVIGTQTWMAENLNYADSSVITNLKGNSWCYENSMDSCTKYGRLYTWTAMMDIDSSYQSKSASAMISSPHQGVCPSGWHVPSDAEWMTLVDFAGGEDVAGTKLKSTGGWSANPDDEDCKLVPGTDAYGFSALPAGYRYGNDVFIRGGYDADFWSATEGSVYAAYYRLLTYDYAGIFTSGYDKGSYYALSVRCVKD